MDGWMLGRMDGCLEGGPVTVCALVEAKGACVC